MQAVTEGFGNFRMTILRRPVDSGRLRIDHADPKILITEEVLRQVIDGESPWSSLDGDALRVADDFGRTVVYRIGQRRSEYDMFEAHLESDTTNASSGSGEAVNTTGPGLLNRVRSTVG
jgi:hypothetical protein